MLLLNLTLFYSKNIKFCYMGFSLFIFLGYVMIKNAHLLKHTGKIQPVLFFYSLLLCRTTLRTSEDIVRYLFVQ